MLELKNIAKSYTTGNFTQIALNSISLSFRKSEFVAILGQSGSGKTTCLNVIGGLDRYDSGDLIINGKSSKNFTDADWDAYRNNSIGFIFQSYNLIPHLSILDNVEMGMTLSGVSSNIRRKKAMKALERVGLKDHIYKKPNQLSGGQMQRVAIARALANDPDIILADEPTGALDTITSQQIMDLIKEIAKDKLVIMVTHNPALAEKYADRIIKFEDGNVIHDSNPYTNQKDIDLYTLKKTSMSFLTALKLSGRNISTKKGRTLLTAFASSIGIIGIALVLSLSSGFQKQIDQYQEDALSEFPIIISQQSMNLDNESLKEMRGEMKASLNGNLDYADTDEVIIYNPAGEAYIHKNKLTNEYIDYVENIDPAISNSIGYTRITGMNLLRRDEHKVYPVSLSIGMNNDSQHSGNINSMKNIGLSSYPKSLDKSLGSYLEKNYDLLAGEYPVDETDLVLVVDSKNRVPNSTMQRLGFDTQDVERIKFENIIGTEFKLVTNNDYYVKSPMGNFIPNTDYDTMYDSENNITLNIGGIIRLKPDVQVGVLGNGIAYSDDLVERIIFIEAESEIVKVQKEADYNVITMEKIDDDIKENLINYLGGSSSPYMIFIYPKNFESKEAVISYLEDYNKGKDEEDIVLYNDLASTITELTGGIMNAITLVLVAFAAISLVVSLIMIGIITYISVLERTKEIGILRALGARKKDITRVFNAETFIIGVCSGLLGITIAYILTIPINNFIKNVTKLTNVAQLDPVHAILLITVSVLLTLLGGLIPARMAANKDPVEALRTE